MENSQLPQPASNDNKDIPNQQFPPNGLLGLEVTTGSLPVTFRLKPGEALVLGRKSNMAGTSHDVDLSPYGAYALGVSRNHAELRLTPDSKGIELRDLGSSNGTFLNEEQASPHYKYRVAHGDSLRLGNMKIRVLFLAGNIPLNKGITVETPEAGKPTVDLTASANKAINIQASAGGVTGVLNPNKLPPALKNRILDEPKKVEPLVAETPAREQEQKSPPTHANDQAQPAQKNSTQESTAKSDQPAIPEVAEVKAEGKVDTMPPETENLEVTSKIASNEPPAN